MITIKTRQYIAPPIKTYPKNLPIPIGVELARMINFLPLKLFTSYSVEINLYYNLRFLTRILYVSGSKSL
jgi:hypothetical protein